MNVRAAQLDDGAVISHFNVFRNLRRLELREGATIGQFNWATVGYLFSGGEENPPPERYGYLSLGQQTAIVAWHFIDCMGGMTIDGFTTIAGVRSTILSHQIDLQTGRQTLRPVHIGQYCFVGSNVCVAPGTHIPDRCAIAMGAVVAGNLVESGKLYAGVSARPVKDVGEGAYFNRRTGFVPW